MNNIKKAFRVMTSPFRSSAVVLLYHRINNLASDPQLLCVEPEIFEAQVKYLYSNYRVMSATELCTLAKKNRIPKRAICITFDDGYADNLYNAKSILQKYDLPAVVFVTAGYLGSSREFWWDELERIFFEPETLPEKLQLRIKGIGYEWNCGDTTSRKLEEIKFKNWNVSIGYDPTVRHKMYRSLHNILRPLVFQYREKILNDLRKWSVVQAEGRLTHRCLSINELIILDHGGLIEVGSHGISHSALSSLSISKQRFEMAESRKNIEGLLRHPINSFSYPYGSKSDYMPETCKYIKDEGYIIAFGNYAGIVDSETDLFQTPRFLVRNWAIDIFKKNLTAWFRNY